MPLELERTLARHVARCRFEQLPNEAIAVAKRSIVDGIAAMMAGRRAEGMDAVIGLAEQWGGHGTPGPIAAWLAGAQMRALEFDDCTDTIPIHPTAAVLPSLLVLADLAPMSGKDFLRALVIAQDLHVRFGLAVRKNAMQSGRNDLHRVFAATAGVAAGLGLDEEASLHALGLSASWGSPDLQSVLEGSMALWVQVGNSAAGALQSGLLARAGVTGPSAFLLGRGGYFTTIEPDHDASALLDGLGERFEGVRISVKPYASCRATHAMIDVARALRERVPTEQIERMEIVVSPEIHALVGTPREAKLRPATTAAAQFSAHFATASAWLHGTMGLADIAPGRRRDSRILELASKIHLTADESHRTSDIVGRTELTVQTTMGERITRSSDRPLGGPANPISMEMLSAKLLDCIAHSGRDVARRDLDRFLSGVEDMERSPLARELFGPFASEESP